MESIIGLFNNDISVSPTLERLKEAGIAEERIRITSNPDSVNKLVDCDPACVIKNYTIIGAAIGMGIYAIFGLIAGLCQCNLMQYEQIYGIGAFLGAVLAGTFVGGIIGVLVGVGEAEEDTQLYVQGIRLGSKMISVQVGEDDAERVKQILTLGNVTDMKAL
jgi:hypothetical protein